MSKQDLRDGLECLLRATLPEGSYTPCYPDPKNGGLGIDIRFLRVEPWLHGDVVSAGERWAIAVAVAQSYERCPVLALPQDNTWVFRVPAHFVNPDVLGVMGEDADQYLFSLSVLASAAALRYFVPLYQEATEVAEDRMAIIESVLGPLGNELSGEGV